MKFRALLISLVAIVVVLSACDGDEEPGSAPTPAPAPAESPSPTPSESPTPEVITGSDCPNEAAAAATGEAISGSSWAEAGIDGEGEEGEVEIVIDADAPIDCQVFVVATVDQVTSSNVVEGDIQLELIPPQVRELVDIDGSGAPEVFISVQAGASTEFGALFLLDPVRPVTFGDPDRGNGDLIAFGGGVTHLDGAACAPDESGTVVISGAGLPGKKYLLERTFYRLDDDLLVEIRTEESKETYEGLSRYPEFAGAPFGNCPG
ncbi:MAG: hypothetical protein GEU71_16020 [Actinobacteria bacterium]|nr:hypothetical protein [Actinomycetota bacterium]